MKEIQSLLKVVSDGLKTIAQGVEAISEKVDEITKSQTTAKPKAKIFERATPKKKPARKTTAEATKKKAV